ncbi:tRNA N(3)-methylcytidine methyltransferase METTL8, mitochondrial isoform X1 [Psammomys obesus]|uniref:tRNA N(3)-methylcytidine methyltransferase METTL8, mitochondrial isoform X1 n=2 Tax=Psammomys obesus TaxID=48139 RepID=UPI002452F525|nr:tRNA N(3)-methylcytidine methyltransferase METTL8, mitochondrial isoform X1 [Psammomys obesus]XP_055456295.1 tRNA N(3)-methylcytidine methyltransferase METTL8, mitochondrial isoform X1 [Psammomys obesus]XP_055456296.1 tRNA N(3)-methylcytidine methyltransferase METTL8, mitochondrial isoform X1 [Psammomys obesus]XP_055456297.1 tRNA N(3)-methylcytidine methyltransferase METTL8, mitochondrial isoform X1 [Psammomys obesus]XP_055456298.1 tRNA N(3)-methylcytidine methyltransferase METTL8, mitochond
MEGIKGSQAPTQAQTHLVLRLLIVLFRMNVIWRNCICRLRPGKVPRRCQSVAPPVAPLGSRILTDPAKVFEHNMWDHVQWSKEEEDAARKKVEENSATRVAPEEQVKFESDASKYWDTFYQTHKNKFFKNRNWLLREFPEILPDDQTTKEKEREPSWDQVRSNLSRIPGMESHCGEHSISSEPRNKGRSDSANPDLEEHSKRSGKAEQFPGSNATFRVLEVGCGAGNSVFPILNTLQNIPGAFLYCCDFAPEAVELVKSHESYSEAHCSAFIHDVCDGGLAYPFPDGSLDVVLLIFVLSSIHPDRMQAVVRRLSRLLKPGGMILFRDHGRYDNVQLRFKKGRCLSENFYVRGDGTRAYFFTKGEIHHLFHEAGLHEKQNLVDHRLQVNRKKQVKIHRVWVQGKFQKPLPWTQRS